MTNKELEKNTVKFLLRAIDLVGSQTELADMLGVRQQTISYWIYHSQQVPPKHVLKIEKATKGNVTRSQLRPDIYPSD